MENIKIILWGIGTMGTLMAKILAGKEGVELVGTLDSSPGKAGRPLSEITGISGHEKINVSRDTKEVLSMDADVVLLAVSSFLGETLEPVKKNNPKWQKCDNHS